jgi:predicted ATPase
VSAGLALLRNSSNGYSATGAKTRIPYHIALLAKACEIAGQLEDALFLLDDALKIAEAISERWFASELYRHKGQLLLRQGNSEAAEQLYRQALAMASNQEAKLWELRAASSLASLLNDQGRHSEAHEALAPVHGWFVEGFDTRDFKGAQTLLDQMGLPMAQPRRSAMSGDAGL